VPGGYGAAWGACMPKRIILLLDGTWNDADAKSAADTNIVRFREIIAACLDPTPICNVSEALTPAAGARQFSITARNYSYDTASPKPHLVYSKTTSCLL
jgi:hypothetical protein